MAPAYSVVIPTRDGGRRLFEVLAALENQREAPPFEVVIGDDGSTDGTPELIRRRATTLSVRVLEGPAAGPAAARNRAIAAAESERIALLGDDTTPEPLWLAALDRALAQRGTGWPAAGVIGYIHWHPRLRQTRFLRFLNEEGLQFGFSLIEDPDDVPFNFFYTSNLALERRLLVEEPFDESFPYAAWEDIETGYRLVRRGFRLLYEPAARVAHDHPTSFARFCERQERAGYCAVVFWRKHPELGPFLGLSESGPAALPHPGGQVLREALVRALQLLPVSPRSLWREALRYHYLRGLHRGWSDLMRRGGRA
jgi:GT2 family glycosyltransferase